MVHPHAKLPNVFETSCKYINITFLIVENINIINDKTHVTTYRGTRCSCLEFLVSALFPVYVSCLYRVSI